MGLWPGWQLSQPSWAPLVRGRAVPSCRRSLARVQETLVQFLVKGLNEQMNKASSQQWPETLQGVQGDSKGPKGPAVWRWQSCSAWFCSEFWGVSGEGVRCRSGGIIPALPLSQGHEDRWSRRGRGQNRNPPEHLRETTAAPGAWCRAGHLVFVTLRSGCFLSAVIGRGGVEGAPCAWRCVNRGPTGRDAPVVGPGPLQVTHARSRHAGWGPEHVGCAGGLGGEV